VRLLGADLAKDQADVRSSLAAIRDEIEELSEVLDRGEEVAPTLPHRARSLELNSRLSRRILTAFSDWLDEVERELAQEPGE
jgi:hypothetical protein